VIVAIIILMSVAQVEVALEPGMVALAVEPELETVRVAVIVAQVVVQGMVAAVEMVDSLSRYSPCQEPVQGVEVAGTTLI
jgi:hypothetical protein